MPGAVGKLCCSGFTVYCEQATHLLKVTSVLLLLVIMDAANFIPKERASQFIFLVVIKANGKQKMIEIIYINLKRVEKPFLWL